MKDEIREVKEDIRGTLHEIAETFKPQVIIDEKKCEACERSEKLTGHNPTFPLIWASVDQERENVLSAGTDTPAPAWYHVTNNQFPFKSKYVWCKAKNEFEDASLTAAAETVTSQWRSAGIAGGNKSVKADIKQQPVLMYEDTVLMQEKLVNFHLKCLAGRILTLVDAMISGEAQNKAFKTYVKKEFREQFNRVFGFFHNDGSDGVEKSDQEELDAARELD